MATSATIPYSDITFRRDGAGGTAAVFMHGFIDDQHVWNPVISHLAAPDVETVQLDLAGFGERIGASGPFTYDRLAADLSAVVDAVDKPFVLIGHSMSAPIVELVATGRPGRALGLVLISPLPIAGTRLPEEAIEMFRSLGALGATELLAARRQTAPTAPEAELERIAAVTAKARPEIVRTLADLWNDGYPTGGRPSGFSGPVLVLSGADDTLATGEVIAGVTARFGAGKVTVTEIEKSGHWPQLEHPSAVAAEIARFVAANAAG